jgi:hypothetical protein
MTMARGSAYGQAGSEHRAVLSAKRATRLARRATRQRDDGGRSARAWRAWRRLAEAGERGDRNAIDAVWLVWLRDPGDDMWEALTRWWGADEPTERACRAVTESNRPAAERASITAFCIRRGLAPGDENQRAVFYVLTGQAAKYRAADPDGSRLAAGYQDAAESVRVLLRQVMAGHSDLDLPYIPAAHRPDHAAALAVEEGRYLADHLAGRRDWPALWQLARDLPLVQAVTAMRLFSDAWRPDDDRNRALFGLLAGADPDAVGSALSALETPALIRIEMDDTPTRGSFSPDSGQLLVATERDGRYSGCRVFELPGGTLAERHDYRGGGRPPQTVLHLGEAFFVVGCRGFEVWELVRYTAGQPEVIEWNQEPIIVARHPAGFVMEKWRLGSCRLRLYDARGEVTEEVTVGTGDPAPGVHLAAADPGTGRLALRGTRLWILDSDWTRVLAKLKLREQAPTQISFVGPERVVVIDENEPAALYDWRGNRTTIFDYYRQPAAYCRDFVPLRGGIAVLDQGAVRYLSSPYLGDARPTGLLQWARGQALWGSADRRSHALGGWRAGHGFVDVAWGGDPAVQELARRPMAGAGPDDLAAVAAALRASVPGPTARPFLELLQACLQARRNERGEDFCSTSRND